MLGVIKLMNNQMIRCFIPFYVILKDRQCTYNVIFRRSRATIVVVEKAVSITYAECVSVALGIQHAMRVSHIVIRGQSGSAVFFHIIS